MGWIRFERPGRLAICHPSNIFRGEKFQGEAVRAMGHGDTLNELAVLRNDSAGKSSCDIYRRSTSMRISEYGGNRFGCSYYSCCRHCFPIGAGVDDKLDIVEHSNG